MVIERRFRSMKRTQIKMTSMFHWASRGIETHVKICVLALVIERIAELRCGMPWNQISRSLDEIQVTEFFQIDHRVLMRNELTPNVKNMLKLLDITPPNRVVDLQDTV